MDSFATHADPKGWNRIGTWIRSHLSSWKWIGVLGLAYFTSQAIIGSILRPLDPLTVLRLQTTFSPQTFAALLEQWRATGLIDVYWHHYSFDFPHPLLYASFLAAMLAKAFDANRLDSRYDGFLLVPFIAGALDLVENCCHVAMLSDESLIGAPLVILGGLAANLKWAGVLICLLAVGVLSVRARSKGGFPS